MISVAELGNITQGGSVGDDYWWIAMVVAAIGSIGALGAALAAWWSARKLQKSTEADITMKLTDIYSSPKMLEGMRALRNFQRKFGADFAKVFAELREKEYGKVKREDEARRRYSHYFYRMRLLLDTHAINKAYMKKVVHPEHVNFYFEVIVPMEMAINPNYDKITFDTFRNLHKTRNDGVEQNTSTTTSVGGG